MLTNRLEQTEIMILNPQRICLAKRMMTPEMADLIVPVLKTMPTPTTCSDAVHVLTYLSNHAAEAVKKSVSYTHLTLPTTPYV